MADLKSSDFGLTDAELAEQMQIQENLLALAQRSAMAAREMGYASSQQMAFELGEKRWNLDAIIRFQITDGDQKEFKSQVKVFIEKSRDVEDTVLYLPKSFEGKLNNPGPHMDESEDEDVYSITLQCGQLEVKADAIVEFSDNIATPIVYISLTALESKFDSKVNPKNGKLEISNKAGEGQVSAEPASSDLDAQLALSMMASEMREKGLEF